MIIYNSYYFYCGLCIMFMNKNKTLYFRKTHKLFIHLVAIRGEYHFNYTSASFANSEDILSTTTIQPNKIIDIVTIDTLEKGKEILDSEVILDVHLLHSKIKHLVGRVSFDLRREKILNPNSSQFYKKVIKQGDGLIDGYIQYKFVALNTAEITEQTYNESRNHKNSIEIQQKSLQISQEYKRLLTIVAEKDSVIKNMEEQIHKLMNQTKRLSINIRDQQSKETPNKSPISLSIHMKPSNKIQNQHKRLIRQNQTMKIKLIKYGEVIEKIQKEKRILQEEIQLMNDLNAAKEAGSQGPNNASIIQEKKAFLEQLKKSVAKSMAAEKVTKDIKIEDLPEYSEINRMVNERTDDLKQIFRATGKFDDQFNYQKDNLLDKLKNSIKQIDLLKDQIQSLHVQIRKLSDELKILRKNTSSEGIMAKIEAIRNQNEKVIDQLQKSGAATIQEQIFIYKCENYLIEIELLKKKNEQLTTHFYLEKAQMDKRYRDEVGKVNKFQEREAALSRERDSYKMQLDEAKASLERYFNANVTHENVGATAEELSKQLTLAIKNKEGLEKSLVNQKTAFASLKDRYDQLILQSKSKNEELDRLKKMEVSFKVQTQRLGSVQGEIKSYQKKYNQLKSMARNIENTFQNKRRYSSQEKYDAEMVEKLQTFQQVMRDSQKGFLDTQIQTLKEEKQNIIEEYYNDIKRQYEKIDSDQLIQQQQKKILKEAKEKELSKIKDTKLESIELKITDFNNKKADIETRPTTESMPIPQRLATIEKMLKNSTDKALRIQSENQQLKQSIVKMKQTEQVRNEQINNLKESNSKLSGSGVISGVHFNAIHESRLKYMEQFSRINEETKRKLKVALADNNDLKIKNSMLESGLEKQKIQFTREKKNLENDYKEKQRILEVTRIQRQREQVLKAKKIQSNDTEITKLKGQRQQLQNCIVTLQDQLKKVSFDNDSKTEEITQLNRQINRYRNEIQDSNKGMDLMMATLEDLKKSQEQKVATLEQLMEDRSNMFIKIEKIKDNEISQLRRVMKELEDKIEVETYESIKLKEANNTLNEQLEAVIKEKNGLEESLKLKEDNFKKELEEYIQKANMLEDINQQVERQLLSLAEDYQKSQEEAALGRVRLDALQKQQILYKNLEQKIVLIENAKKKDKDDMNYIIQDKKEQLQKYSTELTILQERLKMLSQQNQKIRQETTRYEVQSIRLKEKLDQKCLEVIALAEQKSILNIQKAKKESELEDYHKRCKEQERLIDELKKQLEDVLEEVKQEAQNKKLHIKKSQSRRSRISRHGSMDEIQFGNEKPSFSGSSYSPEEKKHQIQVIENVQSLQNIEEIKEEPMNEEPSSLPQDIIQDNLQTKSIRSDRSNLTKKSTLSKRKENRDHFSYNSKTPEMIEISNDHHEREIELLRDLNEVQAQRDNLLNMLEQMKLELQRLKFPSDKKQSENIKINDSEDHHSHNNSATFSLGNKINFLDSRQLNNTNEGTEKEHSKDVRNYQLLIEELERQRDDLRKQIDEQRANIENLIKASEELQQDKDELMTHMEEMRKEYELKCLQGEEMQKQHEQKIEQMVAEIIQKQNTITNTIRQLEEYQEKMEYMEQELNNCQIALQEKNRQINELSNTIKKIKNQYRKYEEEAELEILTLKEKFDELMGVAGDKNEDIQELVEKYLFLEENAKRQAEKTKRLQNELDQTCERLFKLQQDNDKIGKERDDFSQARKKMHKRMHELQVELLNQNQKLMDANKTTNLILTKSNIKNEAMEQQFADARNKIDQKQRVIVALKNQIALYNEECSELKRSNDDLDYELQRVTKELKDIMLNYQKQFENVNKEKLTILEGIRKYDEILKEKQHKMMEIRAQMRENERERSKAENELKQIKDQFQRFKNVKNRELNEKSTEFELKNNQLQIFKSTHQKLTDQNYLLESQLEEEKKKNKALYDQYRERMSRYEESFEEVSKELVILADRPSKESWEQVAFQNQLYRNRIQQLEEEIKKKTVSSDDLIAIQFRKYKVKSETVIRNLEQEMEGYSNKVNELEEANYYLRKECESLRNQLAKISSAKYELDEEIKCMEEDIADLKEEVEFYKNRRRHELTKMLNDTDD